MKLVKDIVEKDLRFDLWQALTGNALASITELAMVNTWIKLNARIPQFKI